MDIDPLTNDTKRLNDAVESFWGLPHKAPETFPVPLPMPPEEKFTDRPSLVPFFNQAPKPGTKLQQTISPVVEYVTGYTEGVWIVMTREHGELGVVKDAEGQWRIAPMPRL